MHFVDTADIVRRHEQIVDKMFRPYTMRSVAVFKNQLSVKRRFSWS